MFFLKHGVYSIRPEVACPNQQIMNHINSLPLTTVESGLQSFDEAEYEALSRLNMTADTILAKWHKLTKQASTPHR